MQINYRSILLEVYQERSNVNSSYSLRSFARDLKVAPSTLSEILNGKKGLSQKLARSIAVQLKLPDWEVRYFCDMVSRDHAKSPRMRQEAKQRLREFHHENKMRLLSQRTTKALTSWVDLAILELTYFPDFESTVPWIAKKLNIPASTVTGSVKRLLQAGLLILNEKSGQWSDASPLFSTTDGVPNEAVRNFHKTVLNLALRKLEDADMNSRTLKTVIFSVSESNANRAKQILNDAIAQIVALADESQPDRHDVLCFNAQIFSLLDKGMKT